MINCENEKVISKIDFVRQEIEIKIESIKMELDMLESSFHEDLESLKKKFLEYKILLEIFLFFIFEKLQI